jgi:uncharacterized protein (DUF486 family)
MTLMHHVANRPSMQSARRHPRLTCRRQRSKARANRQSFLAPEPTMAALLSPKILPILLLLASNVFMTFAWYGHLKFKSSALWVVVLASWGIAFFEYWLAVPANRLGHQVYSAAELKTIQEVITLVVFAAFSVLYLKESFTVNHLIGFAMIAGGAAVIFRA